MSLSESGCAIRYCKELHFEVSSTKSQCHRDIKKRVIDPNKQLNDPKKIN
jgi:hypothetical protein